MKTNRHLAIELARAGVPLRDLWRPAGYAKASGAARMLRRVGVPYVDGRKSQRPRIVALRREIVERTRDGETFAAIAQDHGVTKGGRRTVQKVWGWLMMYIPDGKTGQRRGCSVDDFARWAECEATPEEAAP